ncbi:hypothetical protein [Roseibaca sp. Y0-43]|uniref:hypothetical protein n=1 Tax=Roseibaca sp. Y0-43 TaxID=2816854 RepID=UPI001D0CD30B|nr:hypothetical protein [Roseibaca sp. Y0-43]MCC1481878.1 hypothetical protein [Roseibaca sp. Y0-43]
MQRLIALLTPFALALVLALGSVGFARSHNAGAGVDQYVICTGYGLVTISVDENGNRVADGVPCPDSIALSAALPDLAPALAVQRLTRSAVTLVRSAAVHHPQTTNSAHAARAPPVPVLA